MNKKNIAKSLKAKMDDWVKNVDDEKIQKVIKDNALITGGALVSLLNGEIPNDYDVYFKTKEACYEIASYYASKWNENHALQVTILDNQEEQKIECFIKSAGVAIEDGENAIDDNTEPSYTTENEENPTEQNPDIDKPKYRPRYFSTNAISLSDKIQLVIRFYGSVEEIHKNYDFVHCTCSYDYKENEVSLPNDALVAIINKELIYVGSKYPLCSIIRTRKFISRGWSINAGQYVKMALQLNELRLKEIKVLKDQLVGVDSAYFSKALEIIENRMKKDENFKLDNTYLFEIINRIF